MELQAIKTPYVRHERPVWAIVDGKGVVAKLTWSIFHNEYQCSFHRADQWNTRVRDWVALIPQTEGA